MRVLAKNHMRLIDAFLSEIQTNKVISSTSLDKKKESLANFLQWVSEHEDVDSDELLLKYEHYLAVDLDRSHSIVHNQMLEVSEYINWLNKQPELLTKIKSLYGYIVGIGASAGGLEALERFFGSEDLNPDLSYVVIQHLSPDFKSMMPEILARVTPLPIHSIENGMIIEPGHVYLNNPRSDLKIKENYFVQTELFEDNSLHLPINTFLKSLAENRKEKAIAIVLSGTGRDGSLGVKDVYDNSGLVIAQDTKSALYSSMPESAAIRGPAHLVITPSSMPLAINGYVESSVLPEQDGVVDDVIITSENAFSYLLSLLQRAFGIDFNSYKNATLVRRTERRIKFGNFQSLEDFVSKVRDDDAMLNELYRDMLVDVTSFFRDDEAFDILESKVIPEIVSGKNDGESLRIWSAACASGEEAYSVAILFMEEIAKQNKKVDFKVFATDAHKDSILRASIGSFSKDKIDILPQNLRDTYFEIDDDNYKIKKELRQNIIFAPHDLLSDGVFSNIDFVSCRNMLIYLKAEAQLFALTQLSNSLNTNGILFLGSSEHLGTLKEYYEVVSNKWRIYKKSHSLPAQSTFTRPFNLSVASRRASTPRIYQGWERDLVKRLAPDGYVIDSQGQLIEILGFAKKFLKFKAGRVNLALSAMLDEPLATTIKSGLYNVKDTSEALTLTGIRLSDTPSEYLDISFIPFEFSKNNAVNRHYFIGLEKSELRSSAKSLEVSSVDMDRVVGLERELEFTRENLQTSLEEVETTNEELQSTNEELIASNEELQSTNEELSSVNEELITVNAEYQAQNKRLNQSNSDFENFLKNSETLAIFLTKDLKIRMITPSAYTVFELLETDIGRPIRHFSHFLSFGENLIDDACVSALNGVRKDMPLTLRNQRELELSVIPYESMNKGIDGVVLRFIDVTKTVLESNERHNEFSATLFNLSPDYMLLLDNRGLIEQINLTASEILAIENTSEIIGTPWSEMWPEPNQILEALSTADINGFTDIETFSSDAGNIMWWNIKIRKVPHLDRKRSGFLVSARDITNYKTDV